MAKSAKKTNAFPSKVADMSVEQLMATIDRRIASGEVPWPLTFGPKPWPFPNPFPEPPIGPEPWPPFCPACGSDSVLARSRGVALGVPQFNPGTAHAFSAPQSGPVTLHIDQIWEELRKALRAWKSKYADVTEDTKLADMTDSGDGRYDILSAVRRSPFFKSLGLALHYFQIGGDTDLDDVVETAGKLLEDLGHVVQA